MYLCYIKLECAMQVLGMILSVSLYIIKKRERKTNGFTTAYQFTNPTASQFSLENRTQY